MLEEQMWSEERHAAEISSSSAWLAFFRQNVLSSEQSDDWAINHYCAIVSCAELSLLPVKRCERRLRLALGVGLPPGQREEHTYFTSFILYSCMVDSLY